MPQSRWTEPVRTDYPDGEEGDDMYERDSGAFDRMVDAEIERRKEARYDDREEARDDDR